MQIEFARKMKSQVNELWFDVNKAQRNEREIRKKFGLSKEEEQRLLEEARRQWEFIKREQAREFRQVGLSLGPRLSLEPESPDLQAPAVPARLKMTHAVHTSRQKAIQRAAREYQVRLMKERCKKAGGENQERVQIQETSLSFTPDQGKGRPPDELLSIESPPSGDRHSTCPVPTNGSSSALIAAKVSKRVHNEQSRSGNERVGNVGNALLSRYPIRSALPSQSRRRNRLGRWPRYRSTEWVKGYACDTQSPFPHHSDLSRYPAHEEQVQ
jgi:hypothetical protein